MTAGAGPRTPRIALFCNTFREVNGAGLTCRELVAFARRRDYPMYCLRGGPATHIFEDGSVTVHEVRRGWASFDLRAGLRTDPLLVRYRGQVRESLRRFLAW